MTAHEHDEHGGEVGADALASPRRARRLLTKVGLSSLVVAGLGAAVVTSTFSAFTDTTGNGGNQFVAGAVDIDDNDNGVALLSLTNAQPGTSDTGCIVVTSNGSLDSNVRLYGTTTGTGLDQYVTLTVTRGTFPGAPPAFDSCTGFTPDAVNYNGSGNGVIYTGTLQSFPDSWAAGIVDPTSGTAETWSAGETHVYQFVVAVPSTPEGTENPAQGLTAQQVLTWEARNN